MRTEAHTVKKNKGTTYAKPTKTKILTDEATKKELLNLMKQENVKFLRLQFTDILGVVKNVEIPETQFAKSLENEILFDGSSIEGFSRIQESDMLLYPDPSSFRIFPWASKSGSRVARIICDVYHPDHTPFEGCPRLALKKVVQEAANLGYTMAVGPEAEFFLFQKDEKGNVVLETHDKAGYFDLTPVDLGEDARRDIVSALEAMGFEVEAAHHEVAHGQHEIDFKYSDPITTADNVSTFRFVVRKVAHDYGLHATFMPKPIFGINGSGMHTHQSLFKEGKNAFFDAKGEYQLSQIALHYIGGLIKHSRGFTAITNPLVNSYKRLVPGYEAPTHIAWSLRNRSPMIRIPAKRGESTRCELRMPDPACNPYLAFAVMLKSGLDGIKHKLPAGEPVNQNIYLMSQRERARLKVGSLPGDLCEAIEALQKDSTVQEALGQHILSRFLEAKEKEWNDYRAAVYPWEVDRYLTVY
ncbi:MAG: type I glutamate--ammonia ligase [Deltaproteobacteria bacterium]|nr:type I glutamate--ammonia ligase [Deltaproteobacteria bacterium]